MPDSRIAIAVAGLLCAAGFAARAADAPANRMEITLERHENGQWRRVDPQTVLGHHDQIRFRYKSNFPGFLYVMNRGSSGDYVKLFPSSEAGEKNRVEANREYMVPATETGAFRVDGPPGQDTVYWMVMPMEINGARQPDPPPAYRPLPPPPKDPEPPASMTPRCDDTIWKARGECLDRSAGVKASTGTLPSNLSSIPGAQSRELLFLHDKNKTSSVVSSPAPLGGPVVYEFRISHK